MTIMNREAMRLKDPYVAAVMLWCQTGSPIIPSQREAFAMLQRASAATQVEFDRLVELRGTAKPHE